MDRASGVHTSVTTNMEFDNNCHAIMMGEPHGYARLQDWNNTHKPYHFIGGEQTIEEVHTRVRFQSMKD